MSALEERLAQLESKIEHLETLETIRGILARYCKALDDRDAAAMSPFWAKDAVLLTHPWPLEFHGAQPSSTSTASTSRFRSVRPDITTATRSSSAVARTTLHFRISTRPWHAASSR